MVSGTIITEPSFSGPKLDAELSGTGWDYIRQDPDGAHLRLDVRSQAKNKSDGAVSAAPLVRIKSLLLTGRSCSLCTTPVKSK